MSAAVSVLLSVIREDAETERPPRDSELCCLLFFSLFFFVSPGSCGSSVPRGSPRHFPSLDSVAVSHIFSVHCCLVSAKQVRSLSATVPSAGVRFRVNRDWVYLSPRRLLEPSWWRAEEQPPDCRQEHRRGLRMTSGVPVKNSNGKLLSKTFSALLTCPFLHYGHFKYQK